MTVDQDEGSTFDIGVGQQASSGTPQRRRGSGRRTLPIWAVAIASLLIGWMLGTLMNGGPSTESLAQAPEPVELPVHESTFPPPNPPVLETDEGPVEAVYEQTNGSGRTVSLATRQSPIDGLTVVVAQPQPEQFGVPSMLNVVADGRYSSHAVEAEIAESTQAAIGHVDHRVLVVEDKVLFIAAESALSFDLGDENFPGTLPVEVADAASLLPGSESGHAWAVGVDGQSVLDIDVRSDRVRAAYDLANIGIPLASYSGGLIVAPANARLGQFALWSPRRGIEKLWSIDDQTFFIDAAANTIVVQTPRGIASYNAVTGALTQTDRSITKREEAKAFVSPDGAHLAVVERESVAALPNVVIIDLQTGATVDEFPTASESQLHWVSAHGVLSISPRVRPAQVEVRDISKRTSARVYELVGPAYWVTVIER